ncbi:MAG TPA: LytR C-terminal domain-containing protein [Baekduia sp.]
MSSILALSVTDKIEQYGAYAGFASVLGLAILSLLYFAQARELKRLREWAGRAPERALDLQDRAVAAAQQRVVAQPQRPAQPVVPRPAAATPAGQAQGVPAPAAAAAAAATAAGAATATPPGAPPRPVVPGAPQQPTTVQPAAANGAAASPPAARPGEPLRVGNGPAAAIPPGTTRTNYGPDDEDDPPRSRKALFGALAALVVVVGVLVVLLTGVLGGSDSGTQQPNTIANPGASSTTKSASGASKKKTSKTATAAPAPGTYEVAVLNGTTVPGLARGVATRLQNTKFKIGTVTNAATQTRSATLVEFAPGHRAEADAVAKAIDVQSDSIQPLSAGSKTIAGDKATVVVTVGADQNTSPQASTTTP